MASPLDGPIECNVFVGNLAFSVGEEQLKQHFADVGKIVAAKIVTRGPRSMGYGFIQFEDADAAKQAIDAHNGKDWDGRTVNCEQAKPRKELAEGEEAPRRKGRNRRRARGAAGASGEAAADADAAASGDAAAAAAPSGDAPARARRPRRPRRKNAGGAAAGEGAPEPRPPREPSATQVFVGNLPFSVNDERLKQEIFGGFKVVSATVATRRGGTTSKGFGFVELETEEERTRAIAELNEKDVEGRQIAVHIGHKRPQEAPAAAAAAAAAE